MTDDLRQAIGELEGMAVAGLRERYAEVFGEPTRSGNRRWLVRRIAWRLQAQEEGGLSERARRRAAELGRDADIRLRPPEWVNAAPPPGDLRTASGRLCAKRDDRLPAPGTVLTRRYKGREHRVTVLPGGFEYEGRAFKSLSAVAHAITGSHWNGMLFFGLAKRKDAEEATE